MIIEKAEMKRIAGSRMPLLVVARHTQMIELLTLILERERFAVSAATNCLEALALLQRQRPAAIITEIALDDGEEAGMDLCETVRAGGAAGDLQAIAAIPILILAADPDEQCLIRSFRAGANDVLAKPFSAPELVDRMRALLWQAHSAERLILRALQSRGQDPIILGPLYIDPRQRVVSVAGRPLALTATEFDLLHQMADAPEHVFSRQQLLANIWDWHIASIPSKAWEVTRTVDVHIGELRRKLKPFDTLIVTARGVGYKLVPPRSRHEERHVA